MFKENKILNEKVYNEKLHNNMQVFIMPKKGFSKKYAIFATNFGSNDLEYVNPHTKKRMRVNDGIAHFLEHKMFEMPDESNVFETFAKFGASPNAYTNFNMTAYHFSTAENFIPALKYLITYVQTPHFTDENVEKEKGIIAQEIKMYDDEPNFRVFFNMLWAMYKTHPNSIDIAGTVDSIYKITKEELYDCYNTFYSPSNMALFIVGDVEIESTMTAIKESVKDKNMFEGCVERILTKESDDVRQKEIVQEFEISLPIFSMGFKEKNSSVNSGYPLLKKETEMEIINQILFKKGSTLHDKLYKSSLIFDSLYASYTCNKDYGYVSIESESSDVEKTKSMILEEIRYYQKNGVPKSDFERIKRQKTGLFIKAFDSPEYLSNIYLSMYFKGYDIFDYYECLNNINLDDVNYRLKEMFDENQMVMSIVNPKK